MSMNTDRSQVRQARGYKTKVEAVRRKESSGKTEEAKDDKRESETKAETNRQLERPHGTRYS